MTTTERCIKWGIISAGNMASDFVTAVSTLPSDQHKIVAVGAREADRAKSFASRFNIPSHYGSYLELAKDPDVDTVYMATALEHAAVSMMMLEHNKHVLCESPGADSLHELEMITKTARERGLFFMEAHAMITYPAYRRLEEELANNTIGELEHIRVDVLRDVLKFDIPDSRFGIVRSFAHTGIFLALKTFGSAPERIVSTGKMNDKGMDIENTLVMHFKGGKMAVVSSSFCREQSTNIRVFGTKGSVMSNLWWTYNIKIKGQSLDFPVPANPGEFRYTGRQGLIYIAEHVRDMILQGRNDSSLVCHDVCLDVMRVVEDARSQMGCQYTYHV